MVQTKAGIGRLPNLFYGTLKCGFCCVTKPTDEMWWCPICVKILCSKCDVKDHRGARHEVLEWNSLRGVADCVGMMKRNRRLETGLKEFFAKVTREILNSVNAGSEKSELAVVLADAYGIQSMEFGDSAISHDSDKSQELSKVVHQAFSLADIRRTSTASSAGHYSTIWWRTANTGTLTAVRVL